MAFAARNHSNRPALHFRTVLETALDTMFPTLDLDLPLPIEYSKQATRVAALLESSLAIGAVDLKSIVGDSIDLITKDFELETRSAEVGLDVYEMEQRDSFHH